MLTCITLSNLTGGKPTQFVWVTFGECAMYKQDQRIQGRDVRGFFIERTRQDDWTRGKWYSFPTVENPLFSVEPLPIPKQPGNGKVYFNDFAPHWKELMQSLQRGFRSKYKAIWNEDLSLVTPDWYYSTDFEAFVLIQFEIVRRWKTEKGQLPRGLVAQGIDMALLIDEPTSYQFMASMFEGSTEERYSALERLKRQVFPIA